MIPYYYKTNFDFSDKAKNWILDRYALRFDSYFYHDLDITQIDKAAQIEWKNSPVGSELLAFLANYDCDTSYYGINVFISNTTKSSKITSKPGITIGNPHVDSKFSDSGQSKIKSRFNIMILGNMSDPMFWWGNVCWGDSRLVEHQFTSLSGQQYTSLAVPGDNPDERWQWLGPPNEMSTDMLTPSAFVRTDCVHAVCYSSEPRLIVTVAIDKTIEEILQHPNNLT